MPQAIIFDLFYTILYDEGTGTREKAIEVAQAAGIAKEDWLRGWRAAGDLAARGRPGTTRGRVARALEEIGHDGADSQLIDELTGLMFVRQVPRLYPDTRQTLSDLGDRGYRVGLISNCFGNEAYWPGEFDLEQCFDAMVMSCQVGMVKPEPGIYTLAAERLGVPPAQCVFVDDVPSYVAGAMAIGMTGVRINRFHSEELYAEHEESGAELGMEPALRIRELGELVEWLDERQGE